MSAASLAVKRGVRHRLSARDRLEIQRLANVIELAKGFMAEPVELQGYDWRCPYCGVVVLLKTHHILRSRSQDWIYFSISECPRQDCGGVIFVTFDSMNTRIQSAYPYPNTSSNDFPDSIPEPVRDDMAEAIRAFAADCLKSVVVMCRRAFQNVAVDKKVPRGGDIKDQIKWMYQEGLITKSLADAAQEIRHFGGFAAHPQDDELKKTTYAEARSVWNLLDHMVRHIYVMPAETAELAKRRQSVKQKP